MGRLRSLPSMIKPLEPRISPAPKVADDLYASAEWRRFASRIKRERSGICCVCGSSHRVTADHIVEVKDGGALFDPRNVQLLCQAHHNEKTAAAAKTRAKKRMAGG